MCDKKTRTKTRKLDPVSLVIYIIVWVGLSPINVKTTEAIGPNCFGINSQDPEICCQDKILNKFCKSNLMMCCRDVVGAVLRELMNQGKLMKLQKFEIPGAVSIYIYIKLPAQFKYWVNP